MEQIQSQKAGRNRNKGALLSALLLLLGGALSALPLVFSSLSLFAFVFLSPFCYFLYSRAGGGTSLWALYGYALCYFQGYYMGSFSFFTAMYPLEFAGLSPIAALAVLFAATVLLPLLQAVGMALLGPLTALIGRRLSRGLPLLFPLAVASLWTLLSYLQNLTWMGVPWAPLSIALARSPLLIQSASLFGHHFLIFLLVAVNALLAEAVARLRHCRERQALLALAVAVALFGSNLLFGALRLSLDKEEEQVTVAVLQGNVSTMEDALYGEDAMLYPFASLARAAAKSGKQIDLMLWAEAVFLDGLESHPYAEVFLSSLAKETGVIQVVGSYSLREDSEGEEHFYNSLFVFYPDGTISEEIYDKRRPVPFGEYLPWASFFVAVIPPLAEINMLARNIEAGEAPSLFSLPFGRAGGLICFDSLYPALARESTRAGAELLLLATNDSWFDGSFAKDLHFSHAVLRAVENGRAVARAGNTGLSGFISPKGEIEAITAPDTRTLLTHTVTYTDNPTLYTAIGDSFMLLPLLYVLTLSLYPVGKRE